MSKLQLQAGPALIEQTLNKQCKISACKKNSHANHFSNKDGLVFPSGTTRTLHKHKNLPCVFLFLTWPADLVADTDMNRRMHNNVDAFQLGCMLLPHYNNHYNGHLFS